MIQTNESQKSKITLDDSRQIGCNIKFDMTKAMSINYYGQEKAVQLPANLGNVTAYLRLVNAEGHPWTSTAVVRVQCPDVTAGKYYSQNVFRIPQWQPTWFIDVTDIARGWAAQQVNHLCLTLTGGTNEDGPVCIYNECNVLGFQPMLVLCCDEDELEPIKEHKLHTALWSLQNIYTHRDLSWSGCFVRNAQANMHRLTGNPRYLNALQTFYDNNLDQEGRFLNISEEYFYVAANGSALLYLYKITKDVRYTKALENLKNGVLTLPKSECGIIMAGNRTEAELIFCVCDFLAQYADEFDDYVCSEICIKQAISILELLLQGQDDMIPLQNIEKPYSKGWSRGMGWIVAGIAKILNSEGIKKQPLYSTLLIYFKDICYNIINYQKENGMYRSIIYDVNKPSEVTGSGLIALGFELGFQCGALPDIYHQSAMKTLSQLPRYSKTGMDMSGCFPMNFHEKYYVTDFSGNSDQGYGVWMELYSTIMLNMMRSANNEEYKDL